MMDYTPAKGKGEENERLMMYLHIYTSTVFGIFIMICIWVLIVFIALYGYLRLISGHINGSRRIMFASDLMKELARITYEHGDDIDVVICKDGNEQGVINTINYNEATEHIELSIDTIRDDAWTKDTTKQEQETE